MQLNFKDLSSHLAKNLNTLYVLHGDEVFLQNEAAETIRSAAHPHGYTERSVHVVQGAHFDWTAVMADVSSRGLFSDKHILELRIPSGKPGKEGSKALQALASLINQGTTSSLLLILLPYLDRTTLSSDWYTALQNTGVAIAVPTVEQAQLPNWIRQRLAHKGLQLAQGDEGSNALNFLANKVEGNLLAAHQEIEKLSLLYPEPHTTLSLTQVQEAVVVDVAKYKVFELGKAVWEGQALQAQKRVQNLRDEGIASVLVHWVLAQDIATLLKLKKAIAAGKSTAQALREERVWGDKEKTFAKILPQLTSQALQQSLWQAHCMDGIVKGIEHPQWPSDPWQALEVWVLLLCKLAKHHG